MNNVFGSVSHLVSFLSNTAATKKDDDVIVQNPPPEPEVPLTQQEIQHFLKRISTRLEHLELTHGLENGNLVLIQCAHLLLGTLDMYPTCSEWAYVKPVKQVEQLTVLPPSLVLKAASSWGYKVDPCSVMRAKIGEVLLTPVSHALNDGSVVTILPENQATCQAKEKTWNVVFGSREENERVTQLEEELDEEVAELKLLDREEEAALLAGA